MPALSSVPTKKCRNCSQRFPWKKDKKFCSVKCKDEFHNAGSTPAKALEAKILKLLKSERFLSVVRSEIRKLQSANAAKPQAVLIAEQSAKLREEFKDMLRRLEAEGPKTVLSASP